MKGKKKTKQKASLTPLPSCSPLSALHSRAPHDTSPTSSVESECTVVKSRAVEAEWLFETCHHFISQVTPDKLQSPAPLYSAC